MAEAATTAPTLAGALWPSSAENRAWRAVLLAVLGSAFLALLAQIEIPFWPVPQTMQTFGVMVIGMTYGWRLAGRPAGNPGCWPWPLDSGSGASTSSMPARTWISTAHRGSGRYRRASA